MDIEELYNNKNDIRVLSYCQKDDIIRFNKIISKRRIISSELIQITTNTGRKIISTPDHRYYTRDRGYIEAQQLQCGDRLTIANEINMRKMWENILQKKARFFKRNEKRLQTPLLFKTMFVQHKFTKPKDKKVCNLWGRSGKTQKVLLGRVQEERADTKQEIVNDNMSDMQKRVPTEIASNEILLIGMQKQIPLNKDERKRELKLQKWYRIPNRIFKYKGTSKTKGQLQVSNMWCRREKSEEQEIWDNIEFINTSQRQEYKEQQHGQFDNIMQDMSYSFAQDETITEIKYIKKRTPVYDIQVEKDENFFANGVLVHNCSLMIIDDLIKNVQEAYNENILQKQIDWFNNTMLSRTETRI